MQHVVVPDDMGPLRPGSLRLMTLFTIVYLYLHYFTFVSREFADRFVSQQV